MTLGTIPFRIPAEHLSAVAMNKVQRYGAILKNTQTGRIVGHVQQTGVLERALQTGLSFDPTGVTGLIGVAQNAQISSKISALQSAVGTLQTLQLVNLASSVAGIGVTAASTAMILHRLNGIGEQIGKIEERLANLPNRLRELELRKTLVDIGTTLERLDNAERRKEPEPLVRAAEEKLHYGFDRVLDGANSVVAMPTVDAALLRSLIAGLSLCGAAQVKALFWLNELDEAEEQARRQYYKFEQFSLKIPHDILQTRLGSGSDDFASLTGDMVEIRARLASMPSLSARVAELDVNGRDYLRELENEQEQPLLLLPA